MMSEEEQLLFGHRDSYGNITKFPTLLEAIQYWRKRNEGSVCENKGRWYTLDSQKKWNRARELTALHMLGRYIKQGYSLEGTDFWIEGWSIFGSYGWPKVRNAVLERDGHTCQLCKSDGTTHIVNKDPWSGKVVYEYDSKVLEVHHILPRHQGGSDHPINLITLCGPCHKMMHRKRDDERLAYHKYQTRLEVD